MKIADMQPIVTPGGTIYAPIVRDATAEEEASLLAQAQETPVPEMTEAERIASLEQQLALLLEGE